MSITKPIPDVQISTYTVRFDYMDYDMQLPYYDDTLEKDIWRELRRLYKQCK